MQPHLKKHSNFISKSRYTYYNKEYQIIVNKLKTLNAVVKQWESIYIIGLSEKINRKEPLTENQKLKIRELECKYLNNKKRVFG